MIVIPEADYEWSGSIAQKPEVHLEKLCNAIGLPPILCVFLALGVFIGLLGIARTMIDGGAVAIGQTLVTR